MNEAEFLAPVPIDSRIRERLRGGAYRLTGDRTLAEDIAQEAVLRVLSEGEPRDLPYLFQVVLNLVRNEARRIARRRTGLSSALDRVADPADPGPLQNVLADERDRRLWSALGTIPDRERSVLLLRFAEGMTCSEIARVTGASPNAVSCLIHRGKERMRELLAPRSMA